MIQGLSGNAQPCPSDECYRAASGCVNMSAIDIALTGMIALANMVEPTGRFSNCHGGRRRDGRRRYNQLRHAGTLWATMAVYNYARELAQSEIAVDRAFATIDVKKACATSLRYLVESFMERRDGEAYIRSNNVAKLGGAALAILAILELHRADCDHYYLETAVELGRYICRQQRADGDFCHIIDIKSGGIVDRRSDYYTGEAIFAISELYRQTRDDRLGNVSKFSASSLNRMEYGVNSQSHWYAYALYSMYIDSNDDNLLSHAKKIAKNICDNPSYRRGLRSAPIACRTEALLSFIEMVLCNRQTEDISFLRRCLNVSEDNLRYQLLSRDASGLFLASPAKSDIRVDYTQHNISSFCAYDRIKRSPYARDIFEFSNDFET